MRKFLDRLRQALAPMLRRINRSAPMRPWKIRSRDRIGLVMRLENTELLADYLGQGGFAHLLAQMSIRMTRLVRPHDPVQITAPGVFAIILRTRSEIEAMHIAQRLQANCQSHFSVGGMTVTPAMTGVLILNPGPRHVPTAGLLGHGHAMLEQLDADRLGQITLVAHDGEHQAALAATVAQAADAGQIVAWFQPQICCNSGAVIGFEALARWNHPARGMLNPGAFMPGMRDADHLALTQTMLRQALAGLRRWDAAGWSVDTVSINLTQADLADPRFADSVLWELDRQDIAPRRLVLEVLESVGPINSSADIARSLSRLSAAGCQLDLDDFGTGYASLDSIRQFGIHRLKIDRSFVTDCDSNPAQQRMILAILALAERLGIETLAEGVETTGEHSFLAQIGCDHVQGYAIAKPMGIDQTMEFLMLYDVNRPTLPDLLTRRAG